jgi:hypothetical protein
LAGKLDKKFLKIKLKLEGMRAKCPRPQQLLTEERGLAALHEGP